MPRLPVPAIALCAALCTSAWCQPPAGGDAIPPHILNLARIQRVMEDQLKRQPNYTCLETIDRYSSPATGGGRERMKPIDRVRIQVAIAGGRELYSWPGAKTFDERPLTELVRTGFMSDGDFAAMARNLFTGRTASITFSGAENVNGRAQLRYGFRISQMLSGWSLRLRNMSGPVGVAGTFEADAATYDLVRLSFSAEDLPPFSTDKTLKEDVVYGKVRLGASEILLPAAVDIRSESFNGERRWNHETFTQCRQYSAESAISFGDGPAEAGLGMAAPAETATTIPAGYDIHLRLDTAIDSARAAVGDEIRATVMRDVRVERQVVAPRGAVATGVIRVFESHMGNMPYYEVGLEFSAIEGAGHSALFVGNLERIAPFPGLHRNAVGNADSDPPRSLGVGYFFVEGREIQIPRGVVLSWSTRELTTR